MDATIEATGSLTDTSLDGMVRVPGGMFLMGSEHFYPEERPVRRARWRHPEGPGSALDGRELHPVVHVAYEDADAYARWAGKELPTEAEWEYAARGGLEGATYTWGDEPAPGGKVMANTWAGRFPWQNLEGGGYAGTSPVMSFPPNGYGLYDAAGNVWEWTSDPFVRTPRSTRACCAPPNPRIELPVETEPARIEVERRAIKGGSHLCAPSYCLRYRPAARQGEAIDTSTSHLGFRCLVRGRVAQRRA